MIQTVSKAFFSTLAGTSSLKHLASRYGMRGPRSFARRFIAGETAEEAITAARAVEAAGMQQSVLKELERALELTPDSDRVKQWLKRIKRGGV